MALTMERPAPERWIPDGGSENMTEQPSTRPPQDAAGDRLRIGGCTLDTTAAAVRRLTAPTLRAYLQYIIDDTTWTVEGMDGYADTLAAALGRLPAHDPVARALAEMWYLVRPGEGRARLDVSGRGGRLVERPGCRGRRTGSRPWPAPSGTGAGGRAVGRQRMWTAGATGKGAR